MDLKPEVIREIILRRISFGIILERFGSLLLERCVKFAQKKNFQMENSLRLNGFQILAYDLQPDV
ncbi:MAG: hypothetical protein CMI33_05375 [Opitutales bacterium]|nr:hypothetical protein [Opitutales bacterium]